MRPAALLLSLIALCEVSCFIQAFTSRSSFSTVMLHSRSGTKLYGGKDDEIRQLEEKLRQLKKEPVKEKIPITPRSSNGMGGKQDPFDAMLSEQWKQSDPSQNGVGPATNGAIVIATLLALVIFSQIPIGQEDLSKYQGASPSGKIDLGDLNPVNMNQY